VLARLGNRLTYSNVVATLALFLALGGTSVAALKVSSAQITNNGVRSADLRNNDVRAGDIRNNDVRAGDIRNNDVRGGDLRNESVTGADLRNGSVGNADLAPNAIDGSRIADLNASDFAPGQLPDPVPATLPSGKSLTGVFVASVTGGAGDASIGRSPISFPFPLAGDPRTRYVELESPPSPDCPGTRDNPRAAPGVLCVFETGRVGTITFRGVFNPVTSINDRSSRFGAVAFVNGESGASIRGTWAVTAP